MYVGHRVEFLFKIPNTLTYMLCIYGAKLNAQPAVAHSQRVELKKFLLLLIFFFFVLR